jgi:hypothetical protein
MDLTPATEQRRCSLGVSDDGRASFSSLSTGLQPTPTARALFLASFAPKSRGGLVLSQCAPGRDRHHRSGRNASRGRRPQPDRFTRSRQGPLCLPAWLLVPFCPPHAGAHVQRKNGDASHARTFSFLKVEFELEQFFFCGEDVEASNRY